MLDDYMEVKARLDQLEAKVDRLLQWGLVDSVDLEAARLVVDFGSGFKSMPLPWAVHSGRAWIPPVAGEQCLLVAPHGEMLQGVVLVGISKKDEGRGDKDIIEGALEHDRVAGTVKLADGDKPLTLDELLQTELNKIATTLGTGSNGAGTVAFGTPYTPASTAAEKVTGQ